MGPNFYISARQKIAQAHRLLVSKDFEFHNASDFEIILYLQLSFSIFTYKRVINLLMNKVKDETVGDRTVLIIKSFRKMSN